METIYRGRKIRIEKNGKYIYWATIIDKQGEKVKGSIMYDGRNASEALEAMINGIDRIIHYNGC